MSLDDQDLKCIGELVLSGTDEPLPILGLSHLGIFRTLEPRPAQRFWQSMSNIIKSGATRDLRTVRLLCERSPVSPNGEHWKEAIIGCQEHNLRLEDMDGQLLSATERNVNDVMSLA